METNDRTQCSMAHRAVCAADMRAAIRVLEGRWKMILPQLSAGPVWRFSALEKAIPGVSQKMLSQQLRELERDGVIFRTVHAEIPPRVEYGLTETGRALAPVFLALMDWAELRKGA